MLAAMHRLGDGAAQTVLVTLLASCLRSDDRDVSQPLSPLGKRSGIEILHLVRSPFVSVPGRFPNQNALPSKSLTSSIFPQFRWQVVFLHHAIGIELSLVGFALPCGESGKRRLCATLRLFWPVCPR